MCVSAADSKSRQPFGNSFSRLGGWREGYKQHPQSLAKKLTCQAKGSSLDIEYIHPPREGKLESENLRGNVRKQVDT